MKQQDPLLIFMHIPKTGGITLRRIIKGQYNKRVSTHKLTELAGLKEEIEHSDVLMGHLPYGVHRRFSRPCRYITMMRDPVERIISLYFYLQNTKKHPVHSKVKDMDLDQFVRSKDVRGNTSNLQTRYFCEGQTPNLKQAKETLHRKFLVVGITERFMESLDVIKQELDWGPFEYQKRNVTKNRPTRYDFPTSTIDKIINLNNLDYELYLEAKEKFNEFH